MRDILTPELRVGVFGAGVFAGYHANKVSNYPRTRLSGIYDPDQSRAERLAEARDSRAAASPEHLFAASDAVIIAAPAVTHGALCLEALHAGCHVLVEKPLAVTRHDADAIIAARGDRVVQVGHQERVVLDAIGLAAVTERPTEINIRRHGPKSARSLDASVVWDLMIHDLDLLGAFYGVPDWVATEAATRSYSDHWDSVRAELGYSGFTAYVSASRDAEPERRWRLRFPSGTVEIDFGAKTLRQDAGFALNENFAEDPAVQDSLAAAFDRFVCACLDGDAPLASAEDGRAAVDLATQIEEDATCER